MMSTNYVVLFEKSNKLPAVTDFMAKNMTKVIVGRRTIVPILIVVILATGAWLTVKVEVIGILVSRTSSN